MAAGWYFGLHFIIEHDYVATFSGFMAENNKSLANACLVEYRSVPTHHLVVSRTLRT